MYLGIRPTLLIDSILS